VARTNSVIIRTPEGIAFTLLPAGPVVRSIAWSIDLACIAVIFIPVSTILGLVAILSPDWSQAAKTVLFFLISLSYAMAAEWWFKGQTMGKRLLALRVVDAEGMSLRPSQIVSRNLLRIVDSLPLCYLVGGLSCVLTGRSQRLGDIVASTIVIREPHAGKPDLARVGSNKYNSIREHRLLAGRLRQRTSQQASDVALQACLRRKELEPSSRAALFTEIADYFKELVPLPEEITRGIGAEQLVVDVVEVLFTPGS
jgi:uncharacterized RDD family membrane protein YckC